MAFNNCLKEISGKLSNIYTNKKTSQHLIKSISKQFEDLRDYPFNDDCLVNFVKSVEQFTLILIQHSNQLDGNEKYIPIFRASLHSILSVIDTHHLYGRFILKSSTMLNKFFECATNTISLKEFFKFYNLCLTRADKNSICSLALKHKVTCFKTFDWIKLVRDPEFQFVLTETVCRLTENNSTLFEFFANEPDLKKSFDSIDLKQPYKQIREFVSLINANREDLYSVSCKRITIDGNVMENVKINNEILPLYLYFDMYDCKLSFYCNENLVSEIVERPFNNLEFVTFLSHEMKDVNTYYEANGNNFCVHVQLKSSILNLTPNNRLDKYRNFIFCASDQLDNFTEFVKIVFSPLFPPSSQIVLEGSFDSTIFNNISRCDTSKSSIQSILLNTPPDEVNLECNNIKTKLDNGHNTSLLDRALMTSPTAEMSMLSTTFETLIDINSDEEEEDEEITMKDIVNEGQTEVIKRRNTRNDEIENPINVQMVNKPNPVQMNNNQALNQIGSTETTLIVTLEENPTSKVTRWLETTDDIEIIDELDNDNNIVTEIDDKKNEAVPTDKPNGENKIEDEYIVISDDESDPNSTRFECVTNNKALLDTSNKNINETKMLTISINDDLNCTRSSKSKNNCDNVINNSNNQCNDDNKNEDIKLIDEPILDIPAKTTIIDDCLINDSHNQIENIDNSAMNVSEANIETEIDNIVNTETVINKSVSIEKNLSIKDNDKQPLNTNELLSILEDTENETTQQSIIILSSNKTAPKKRKPLFLANETKFYEFSSGEFFDQHQKNNKESKKTTVKQKKDTKEINDKKVANKTKEKKTVRKKKETARKSNRSKKKTEFYGFNDADIQLSTTQKSILENDKQIISGSFSRYDFEKSDEVNIVAQNYEPFGELKDYVLNKRKKWQFQPKPTEKKIEKTMKPLENATKHQFVDDESNEMTNSDDEIVSPFKNTKYSKKKKRILSSESSDFDGNEEKDNSTQSPKKAKCTNEPDNAIERQSCKELNSDINEEEDNSIQSLKKGKCTNEPDNAIGRQSCKDMNNGINEEKDTSTQSTEQAICTDVPDKINIISNITINGPVIETECACLQDFYNIVKREVDYRKYHHPQLTQIPDLIKQVLQL